MSISDTSYFITYLLFKKKPPFIMSGMSNRGASASAAVIEGAPAEMV